VQLESVEVFLKDYNLSLPTYLKVGEVFYSEMVKGLSKAGNADASLKMLITYVRNLPTGKGASDSLCYFS